MKLTIGTNVVEIKVKGRFSTRATDADTKRFLNELSLALEYAARYENEHDHDELGRYYREFADDIYFTLSEAGYYDGIRG